MVATKLPQTRREQISPTAPVRASKAVTPASTTNLWRWAHSSAPGAASGPGSSLRRPAAAPRSWRCSRASVRPLCRRPRPSGAESHAFTSSPSTRIGITYWGQDANIWSLLTKCPGRSQHIFLSQITSPGQQSPHLGLAHDPSMGGGSGLVQASLNRTMHATSTLRVRPGSIRSIFNYFSVVCMFVFSIVTIIYLRKACAQLHNNIMIGFIFSSRKKSWRPPLLAFCKVLRLSYQY